LFCGSLGVVTPTLHERDEDDGRAVGWRTRHIQFELVRTVELQATISIILEFREHERISNNSSSNDHYL
jgi:hypothetical protein